jgi:hypothetical protein
MPPIRPRPSAEHTAPLTEGWLGGDARASYGGILIPLGKSRSKLREMFQHSWAGHPSVPERTFQPSFGPGRP